LAAFLFRQNDLFVLKQIANATKHRALFCAFTTADFRSTDDAVSKADNGSDCSQTLPGPRKVAKNMPSPPNKAVFTPPTN
jgi:hypothetical protein